MPRYYTVKLCIVLQNPGFTGFLAEGLEKPNFDVIFPSGIINLLFGGLTYNTRGHFAHCSHFSLPLWGSEKYYATYKYYMLNHPIRCTYLLPTYFLQVSLEVSGKLIYNILKFFL